MGKRKKTHGGVGELSEKRKNEVYELGSMFNYETNEKHYRRHKHRCYCYLIVEAVLSFVAGVLVAFFFL